MVGWGLPWKWDYCGTGGTSVNANECTSKPAVPADSVAPLLCMDATIQPHADAKEANACAGKDGAPPAAAAPAAGTSTRAYYPSVLLANLPYTGAPEDPYA